MEENNKIKITDTSDTAEEKVNESKDEHHSHRSHHHHNSHRSHHHRHSHHSTGKKTPKSKFGRFLKKNKYQIINTAVAILFVATIIVLSVFIDTGKGAKEKLAPKKGFVSVNIEIPFFESDVNVTDAAVFDFIKNAPNTFISKDYKDFGASDRNLGIPAVLKFEINSIPENQKIENIAVCVDEKSDFSNPVVYSLKSNERQVLINHLKTGTKYFYKIIINFQSGKSVSSLGDFNTTVAPRTLSFEGVKNMRDIGGYEAYNGATVKQGLLYRGCELDGAIEKIYTVPSKSINEIVSALGIKTEMDLRSSNEVSRNASVFGAGVNYLQYNAAMYTNAFDASGKSVMRALFADLANPQNYPIYMHCTHGLDRTGTACYILGALLGVSNDDLLLDYKLSALYHGELWAIDQMADFIGELNKYSGIELKDKAESYLLSCGVTAAEIESIRQIFLG